LFAAPFGFSGDGVFARTGKIRVSAADLFGLDGIIPASRRRLIRGHAYSGIIDLTGFEEDRFYQADWRPDFPMKHIVSQGWTWPERAAQQVTNAATGIVTNRRGLVAPVRVFTSGDDAGLFLNGKSPGRKPKGR
jgi:beta-galactosidase